jgi:hypothetical protein
MAHVDLARAEAGEILDEVKRVAALFTVALLALLIALLIVAIGAALFVCEVLFGSMGWALLLAPLFYGAIAVALVLYALGVRPRSIAIDFLIGLVVGILVALGLAGDVGTPIWDQAAAQVLPTMDPVIRRVLLAVGVVGIIGALLGAIVLGVRGGAGGAGKGFVAGLVLGAIVGLVQAVGVELRVAAAIGVAVALGTWIAVMALRVSRDGIDMEAFGQRFVPQKTIDTTRETMEWVRSRTPLERE